MTPENLLKGTTVLLFFLAAIIVAIYIVLWRKKRQHFYSLAINQDIENWITHILMEEDDADIPVSQNLYRSLRNPRARQYLINELVKCKRNFSGSAGNTIMGLYERFDLKKDSVKKIRSGKWFIKARGIQELFMMNQADLLTTIYKNTNNRNEFVRMEAQTGVIYMTGFAGLRFLDVIAYPLTEWQQIRLLEQLRLTQKKEDITANIPGWLQSKNDTVVIFVLKLVTEYQYFQMRDAAVHCLTHANEKVRTQAVKAVILLADEQTPMILLGYFRKEGPANRALILDALATMAGDEQKDLLVELLNDPDNIIKLKAANVLAKCCTDGTAIVAERARQEPEPFERILMHIKSL
ncbi:HEAT repeat domain-containing protein [Sediminibacterium soli]|uniref:HEAT repeat domain-containing protein n=1 Tax=Sediminibacterium soli TaxID=2698829 RepID=UPI00137AE3BA|nr:HEAT repeat domain-containing protein [Sediminibacterium soli]NCI47187.1 HEAT repeat domain-containing protein [Sediminibacterium soli]